MQQLNLEQSISRKVSKAMGKDNGRGINKKIKLDHSLLANRITF